LVDALSQTQERRPIRSLRQADHLLIDPNQVYRLMVLAKGLRSQLRYCSAGTDKVASRAVCDLEGRVSTAFVVSFASAMRQLECKGGMSHRFSLGKTISLCARKGNAKIALAKTIFPPVLLLDINDVKFIPDSAYPCDAKCIGM